MDPATNPEPVPYEMPHIYNGMPLSVSFDTSFSRPMLGFVNKTKTRSAEILLFTERGPLIYPDCRHRDDPWLLEHPDWLGIRGHAVFILSEAELERVAMREKMEKALSLIEGVAHGLAEVKLRVFNEPTDDGEPQQLDPATPERRRPGRPRKQLVEDVA